MPSLTRMLRSCGVQPSHKERAIGAVRCKKEGMFLQPLRWCCVDCVIHHELVHEIVRSLMKLYNPHALDLTIDNAWVRSSS